MLRRWLKYGDVLRETKRARRELDAIGRAVESVRVEAQRQRVLNCLERWAERVKSFNSSVSK